MKKVLIIHAHPEDKSFCSSLAEECSTYFERTDNEVRFIDLYKTAFNPIGGKHDFTKLKNEKYFKYQLEQVDAYENGHFETELQEHMDNLERCDILVFSFPLWWFGLPAVLKGWVDRVFAMGFVYGNGKGVYENGTFKDKTAFILMTTGGPEQAYNGGSNGDLDTILFPIHHGMFYFTGMTVLPPFISFAPARKSEFERVAELKRLVDYLTNINDMKPIYSNSN